MQKLSFVSKLTLAALGILLLLMMLTLMQIDRQWQRLSEVQLQMQEQTRDLRQVAQEIKALKRGIQNNALVVQDEPSSGENLAVFERAREALLQADYAEGDWLVMSLSLSLKTLTPLVSQDVYASYVQSYVLESLATRDPETLAWQGLLAKSWDISDDGLTMRFFLREDVQFSDGVAFTAEDVVFTFDFIMNPAVDAARERAYLSKIESVVAEGPHTVVFTLSEPYFNAMSLAGGMSILPKHFYQEYLQQPETFNLSKGLLLGSGPYRLDNPKNWSPDAGFVELKRNERYWGLTPSFDRVAWKTIENETARLTAYRNGEIDAYNAKPREYQKLLDDEQLMEASQHFEFVSPTGGYNYIGWNQGSDESPTRFADQRVRQAMTYLLDRQAMINDVMLGYAQVAVSPFSPTGVQHDPNILPREHDLARARELLQQAGYADRNGDGVLEDEKGEVFRFALTYPQSAAVSKELALYFKDQMARAGVQMELKPTEWSVMLESLTNRDFDAVMLGWSSGIESDIFQMFHSSQIEDRGDNFVGYRNARLDTILDQARATVDETERVRLWREAEAILVEDQPYTFLMRGKNLLFVDRRFQGLEQTRLGLNLTQTPVEVYVPAAQQRY